MSKILKNPSTTDAVTINDVGAQMIAAEASYTIDPAEYSLYAASSDIVTKVGNGDLIVNDGSVDLDISAGINLLKGLYPSEIKNQPSPFADKQIGDKKLFRRVHGVKKILNGDTTVSLVIPYVQCKINAIEIVWAPIGLQADLKIYDTPTGAITSTLAATGYTAIPNFMLNQFGFGAGVAKDFYSESSNYDADLIQDMKVEVTLTNPSNHTDEVCVNFVLHELK